VTGLVGGLDRIGEAMTYGRAQLRSIDLSLAYIPTQVSDDSEYWTQTYAILLGDPALRVWLGPAAPLELVAPSSYGPGWQELTVEVTSGESPASGAVVTLVKEGDLVLRGESGADGKVTFTFIPSGAAPLLLRASLAGHVPASAEISPTEP
jgi:hypothetical protein